MKYLNKSVELSEIMSDEEKIGKNGKKKLKKRTNKPTQQITLIESVSDCKAIQCMRILCKNRYERR